MESETPFRVAFVVIALLTGSVAGYHRWQARTGEQISRREEGYLFAIVLRLFGLGLWIAMVAYLISPASVAWAALPFPVWLRWLGVASGGCCPLLMYWTLTSLGKNLTDTVVTRSNAELVTKGPYRWVRHPFYVTTAAVILSVTLLSANAMVGLGGILVMGLLMVRTPKEEQMLIDRFGESYREYMQRTNRYWPRWRA